MTSIAKAPGKIILFGEHFVVYENRAILGAINKYATVTSEKTNTDNILISSSLGQSSIQKDEDVSNVEKKFRPFFYIAKQVIINMVYQIGEGGVSKFKNMWKALDKEDYGEASFQMLDSLWAKQTPNRANKLAAKMRSAKL